MKIVILEGSPNKNGSSNLLAGAFIRGAQEAGHTVEVIDAAHSKLHPCTGCIHCEYEGPCVQRDDMEYEFDIVLNIARNHVATTSKDVTFLNITLIALRAN